MARLVMSEAAAQDLEELTDFLLSELAHEASRTVDSIVDALGILEQHPRIGRPLQLGLCEMVLSRGKIGYLALHEYDEASDLVLILAVRHQR